MHDIWQQILTAWHAQTTLEVIAVLSAIAYLILAIKEHIWCWFFATVSTAVSIYLFHAVMLFSEALLNVFYLIMAVIGWSQWRTGHNHKPQQIQKWPWRKQLPWLALTITCVPLLGFYMQTQNAAFPYLDALTSCFAVFTTFLVVYKVFENWYYWLIIDSLSIYLYWQKGLYLFAALFILYLVLVVIGIQQWSRKYQQQVIVNH